MANKPWTKTEGATDAFYMWAAEMGVKRGRLADNPNRDAASDDLLALVSEWMSATNHVLSDFDSMALAKQSFQNWIVAQHTIKPLQQQTISATITKRYGQVEVTFGWSGVFELETCDDTQHAYAYAVDRVEEQFAHWQQHGLPRTPAINPPASPNGSETETFLAETLEVEKKGDKLYFKVKGGAYAKFGVRVWPEVLEAANMPPDQLYPGEFKLNKNVTVQLVDGKPKKVLSIE